MSERIHVQVQGGAAPRSRGGGLALLLMFPAFGFIAIGVLVFFVPHLLEILVAGAFIMCGVGLLIVSFWLRRVQTRVSARMADFEQQISGGPQYPG